MDEGDIPRDLPAAGLAPHLGLAHDVARDELLESASGEDGAEAGPQAALRQHGEHHGLRDDAVLVGRARAQVTKQAQQNSRRLPTWCSLVRVRIDA